MTTYEKAIYDIVQSSCEHLTVAQVYEILKRAYPNVALATVYNNLNKLWELGFIRKLAIEGSPDRFDRTHRHDHLVCRSCGAVSDIGLDDLTSSLHRQLEAAGIEPAGPEDTGLTYDLKVYYLCPACRAAQSASAQPAR